MTSSNQARYDYRLRIQVPVNSPEALVLKYLKHDGNRVFSHREMVIMAITAYWLVFAYRDAQQLGLVVPDTEMQSVIKDSIYRLNHQASYLHTFFLGQNKQPPPTGNGRPSLSHFSASFPDFGYQNPPQVNGSIVNPFQR